MGRPVVALAISCLILGAWRKSAWPVVAAVSAASSGWQWTTGCNSL